MSEDHSRYSGPPRRRQGMGRVVVALPNGFTLGNLFCGIYAIVQSSRSHWGSAATFIVIGGVLDALDGRVARATGTGSKFGEELDSLVDAISFGLAPAMIMYFAVLNQQNWDWLFVFIYTAGAVTRLARFNVEQSGRAKTHFHGLPSPAAGLTLASYYWFSQTQLYNETILLLTDDKTLAALPWHQIMRYLMVILACLMVSNIPYPNIPAIGLKTKRQLVGTGVILGSIVGVIVAPPEFIFPACVAYILWGIVWSVGQGLVGKRRTTPTDVYWEDEPDGAPAVRIPTVVPMEKPVLDRMSQRSSRVPRGEDRPRRDRPLREPREGREGREGRPPREPRESRESREPRPDRPDRPDRPPRPPRPERPPREPRPDGVLEEDPGMTSDLSREAREREARRRRRRGRRGRPEGGERSGGRPGADDAGGESSDPGSGSSSSTPSSPPPPSSGPSTPE